MSLTEVGRLAIDKNCFRCAVKDATSYGISSVSVILISHCMDRVETFLYQID